jgi:arginine-tRNA-protein transferase
MSIYEMMRLSSDDYTGLDTYSSGVFAVLWQIGQLAENGLAFLYLGFWIKACKKMAYKNAYQPLQVRVGERWLEVIE